MQLEFLESKEGTKTFSANGMFYHSTYSPAREAERFVSSIQIPYKPGIIFIIEPGFSYCEKYLRQKYTGCKLICLRLFDYIFGDENHWDKVIKLKEIKNLSQFLIDTFGEEELLTSFALAWPVAEKVFYEKALNFFTQYKKSLESCKSLLVTRQFFEKKWLLNCCNFIKYADSFIQEKFQTKLPVIICASGPSLKAALDSIKKNQDKAFIICLSSALKVLIQNQINPDLVLSTDGGFWAGQHLKYLFNNKTIPLAASCEAFIPKKILMNNPVLALNYKDNSSFISSSILLKSGIPFFEANRNPTVSGTGLLFAKSLTTSSVFFCGLDLAVCKGFQHIQPNELEKNNELNDNRIKTKEKRISYSRYNSSSLQIYRDWFSSLALNQVEKVCRVIDCQNQNSLGNIKNISSFEFSELLKKIKIEEAKPQLNKSGYKKNNIKEIFDFIINELASEKWQKQIFPADFISIRNSTNEEEKALLEKRLVQKVNTLTAKIRTIADE